MALHDFVKTNSWPGIPRHCSCIYFVLNHVSLTVRKNGLERLGPVGETGPFVRFKFTITVGSEQPDKASLTKLSC